MTTFDYETMLAQAKVAEREFAKLDQEAVNKIFLKIASDLDKAGLGTDDGLTEKEIKKVAEEAGINPDLITSAIYEMNHTLNCR